MRRKDREITDRNEILEVLKKGTVCHVAMYDEPYPYLVALNFGIRRTEDENSEAGKLELFFHSALEGKKLDLLRQNPHVCFEIHIGDNLVYDAVNKNCTMVYESLTGFGKVRFAKAEEKKEALDAIMAHYHMEKAPYNEQVIPRTEVLILEVESMSGKRRAMPHRFREAPEK